MTDLVIAGIRGRMGQALMQLLASDAQLRVIGGIGRTAGTAPGGVPVVPPDAAAGLIEQAGAVIDFSAGGTHAVLARNRAALAGRPLVVGSTGLDADTHAQLDELSHHTAVLVAANFSVGVNLLLALVAQAAAALPAAAWDIEIVEAHHGRKVDAPSGTALALAQAAAQGRGVALDTVRRDGRSGTTGVRPPGEVGVHAVRGGSVVGEHQVHFLGGRERLELRHDALDRAVFAEGALHALRWLLGRPPGRYGMTDVLGLEG